MRIAAANARPRWGRPDAGAERVAEWIAQAGAEGVDVLAFGETHLGGYPFCGSAIAVPDGSWLVEPVAGEERLVIADIDPARVREERQNFDPVGHYSRPDIFQLQVDRRRLSAADLGDEPVSLD
jgi:predicted amidohydrolase